MRKCAIALLLAIAGCTSAPDSGPPGTMISDGQVIHPNQIPVAVTAAFTAEHPYAKITQAAEKSPEDAAGQYTIQYTRPDNSTGKATYAPTGALLHDD